MNPLNLIPAAEAIALPPIWFHLFLGASFVAHLLLINIVIGCGIISLFTGFRHYGPGEDGPQRSLADRLPVAVALAINFGVATLLFFQALYGQFIYVSSQLMAVYWLGAVGLLILAYGGVYCHQHTFSKPPAYRGPFLGISILLFMVIAFVFTSNMTLMLLPEAWSRYFDRPDGTILPWGEPMLMPRYLHFILASVAVGGLATALLGWHEDKNGVETGAARLKTGMKWFTYATIFQIPAGFWFQMSLKAGVLDLFMGGSLIHTGLFAFSMALVVQAVWFGVKNRLMPAAVTVLLLVVAMVTLRHLVREAYLSPYFRTSDLAVTGQYGPLVMFGATLLCVGWILVYVLKLVKKAGLFSARSA